LGDHFWRDWGHPLATHRGFRERVAHLVGCTSCRKRQYRCRRIVEPKDLYPEQPI
jgi:hypothetical protein